MQRLDRSFIFATAALVYVCFAGLQAKGGVWPLVAGAGCLFALAEVWKRTRASSPSLTPETVTARAAIRGAAWGTALWIAARTGPAGRAGFDAIANLGAGVCAVSALAALARIPGSGGILVPHPATRSLDAATFVALLWGVAVALPGTRALLGTEVRLDPLASDYATTTAAAASLLVLVAASWRLRLLRRLEIGVADRAAGALTLSITAVFVAVPAAVFDVAPPDRVLPMGVLTAALACTWAATTEGPTRVSSALRGMLAVMILGAPLTSAAGLLARGAPQYAGPIVLFATCAAIGVGLVARAVAKPLGPEQSRWLLAIDAASRGALSPEPDSAIRAALAALNQAADTLGGRPQLWRRDPEQVLSVDVAGYLHIEDGQAPERLYEIALGEPERTLRAEVLRALEVRRPEVRPLLAWFDARRAFSATLVVDSDGPLGFILLPAGNRVSAMSLEEARGVRILSDRISALFAVSSALARSRQRELAARARVDELEEQRERLEHVVAHEFGRRSNDAERLGRPLQTSAYSPRARDALDRLERLGKSTAGVTLVTPLGVDPVPWAALLHRAGARSSGPVYVADATLTAEQELRYWEDPRSSPLVQADGGTLVLLDGAALPVEVQDYIAMAVARRASPSAQSSVLPPALILTSRAPLQELVEARRLSRALARWIGDAELVLPTLQERPEDIRPLILDALARAGLRERGEPLGIEPHALHVLLDHTWPGNELELQAVLARGASLASGPRVSLADLLAAGFGVAEDAAPTAVAAGPRERRPLRRAPRS
ncbi:MAG TPA: hypothetical protein VI072_18175 [Polyangiaceae bacterium]